MDRNKVTFFYALYECREELADEYGNRIGEYEVIHSRPVPYQGNISAAKGETQTRQFGESESYDKVMVLGKDAPPIDEYSVLWVDTTPLRTEEGELVTDKKGKVVTPYDYVVKKVARSLNSVSFAISKVKVDG